MATAQLAPDPQALAGGAHTALSEQPRVLVIEDSAFVRLTVRRVLAAAGFQVTEACDGRAGVELFRRDEFDVILSDLNMPRLDGFGVLDAARSLPLGPEVIVLTGTSASDVNAAVRALRLGAHDFIAKPPQTWDQLVHAVQRAFEKTRLRRENARLVQELRRASLTDALTGIGNRRALEGGLAIEIERARRYGKYLAVAMFDLDRFKQINDRLGHRVGDAVLAAFAGILQAGRAPDVAYRYGGEEFVLVFAETDLAGARVAAQRITETVAAAPLVAGTYSVPVTCSAGVASLARDDDPDSLIARADRGLYAAKAGGRNRVCASV
jgi:two-component system, cell cycle response regulator